jgi:ATP-dependent DNA ligase
VPSLGFIEPCRPTLCQEAASGGRWIQVIKFGGYRTVPLRNGCPAIPTRRTDDWTRRFQAIAPALATLRQRTLSLRREAGVTNSRGADFVLLCALAADRGVTVCGKLPSATIA